MKIAIVTGAAQGIGRRTAEVLAEAGYRLLLMDMQACTGTVAAIRQSGVEVEEVLGDISDEAVVARAVKVVRQRWGRADVLVNTDFRSAREVALQVLHQFHMAHAVAR